MADKGQLTTPEVQFWLNEASSCIERQKYELCQKNNYPHLINYFEGIAQIDAQHPHVSTQTRYLIINEYFPSINSLISEIMYQNPDILLEATRPDAEEKLPTMKSALRYGFDKADALVENRVALFDMLFAGYCCVEVDQIPDIKTEEPMEQGQVGEIEIEKPSVFDQFKKGVKSLMSPEDAEKHWAKLAPPIESNFSTVQGSYIRRYDPLDVPLDWRAERIKDRRYNLKKVWLSKAEFDVKYPEFSDRVNVEEEKFEYAKHNLALHNSKVLLYEFQVMLRGGKYKTIIVSPYVKTREIDCFERPYTTNGFNMKIGTLHKYGRLYPISFAQVNKKMNDELDHYVRHLMEVAERNHNKYVTDKNKVKTDAKEALRSTAVNDIVEVDGNTAGAVSALQPTITAIENKELLSIFKEQKNKLWSVSESKLSGKSEADFATEIKIQEASFAERNIDIQEGLRYLIQEEMETLKDLIVSFWDSEVFLKLTGSDMQWYEPKMIPDPNDPNRMIVANPLTEELTADYDVKIDIASAARKNRAQQLETMVFYMQRLYEMRQMLIEQGKDINVEELVRVSKEFGWNPEKLLIDHNPAMVPSVRTIGGETITPEEDARRQAEAEAMVNAQGV